MAAIYLLHITFFDALMSNGYKSEGPSLASFPVQEHSHSNLPEENSYRLLVKHEQAKQVHISLPDFAGFLSGVSALSVIQHCTQPLQFSASAHLNENVFRLYRLFRVFLI
jgi:hypothetical protein